MKELNKRKYPRLKEAAKIVYKVLGVEGEYDLDVLDMSGGGLCLPLPQKAKKGTLLELALTLPEDKESFFVFAKVVRQSAVPKKNKEGEIYYETGVEFIKLNLQDKLRIIHYTYGKLRKNKKE